MSKEIVKCDINEAISLEYSSDVKKEFLGDEYYPDNKVCVSVTTITDSINTSNSGLNEYIKKDGIRKYETFSPVNIKSELPSADVNVLSGNNVKMEDGKICPADIQAELCNEQLFCNHCHDVYQDYCTKCRVLVHILNKRSSHKIRELPQYILEVRESIRHLGIFSLKVIPENVRFGPFSGLISTGLPLRIKGGRFVVSDDKLEQLNWMQYINPARNIYEQNLFPFQYEEKLYYCSTRRINVGEELLVYFGEEYEDNLLKNVKMSFVPITKKDVENVFACTFCCLGFSSKEYLAEHKAASHGETKEMFSVEELTQCPFCKMYLEAKEYFEHHMNYCRETNDRYRGFPSPEVHEVESRSIESHEVKKWKRGIYKCTQCKFRTMYSADFKHHTNEHYGVKMYKCGICRRRYKAKESLKAHVLKNHVKHTKAKHLKQKDYKCTECEFKTNYKSYLKIHVKGKHLRSSDYKCTECEYKTNYKSCLRVHIKGIHLKQNYYKCTECEFKTNYKSYLKVHAKAKHLKQNDYKCTVCEFKTNYKSYLKVHVKAGHLKQNNYKCTECEYKTNFKPNLKEHIKSKHLKQNDKCTECEYMSSRQAKLRDHIKAKHLNQKDYKCADCEFKTNYKSSLVAHANAKHLKQRDYKCADCEFKTNYKSSLEAHVKSKHLQQKDYKCTECEYKTNFKSYLRVHIKSKHLKESDYKCTDCEFKTNFKCNLKEHIKAKHLKQNEYKCMECEYKTNMKSYLKKHIKRKHLEENSA